MSSSLENEDLVGVQLVRMEDVQPARDRTSEACVRTAVKDEDLETYIVDDIDYENECIVDEDDSNIGSMVSIQSEEVLTPAEEVLVQSEVSAPCEEVYIVRNRGSCQPEEESTQMLDDDSSTELIVPDVNPRKVVINVAPTPKKQTKTVPESWPTLEILPGGVIKRSEYYEKNIHSYSKEESTTESDSEGGEKMYACAKCSKSFKYLYCLVKHVRWHEKQQKSQQADLSKLLPIEKEMVYLKRARLELDKSYKKEKVDILARIAGALSKIEDFQDVMK